MKNINYGAQHIDNEDLRLVQDALKQSLITTGPKVVDFEKKNNFFLKSKYSLSCSSGTAAIHLALLSLNLPKDATVIMPCINFISAFNLSTFSLSLAFRPSTLESVVKISCPNFIPEKAASKSSW